MLTSPAWVSQLREQLETNHLFAPLFRAEVLPPAGSDGLMQVIRRVPTEPRTVPGSLMVLTAVTAFAKSIKKEADEVAALTDAMIADYQARFHSTVQRLLQLAQSSPLACGFAADFSFAKLRSQAEKLCPKCANSAHSSPIPLAHSSPAPRTRPLSPAPTFTPSYIGMPP